jgi:hypothetical protein
MVLWVGSCKKCFVIGGSLPPARLEHDSAKFVASTCNCWTMERAWRTEPPANRSGKAFFVACWVFCDCFDSICLMFFVETTPFHSLLASVCLPTVFDKPLGLSWGHFGLTLQQRCGERRNGVTLILVEGVTKNRHMCRFFVTPSTQSASWNGEQHSFYCTVCAHSRLYTSLSIMVEPPVPLNWKKTAFWMIF